MTIPKGLPDVLRRYVETAGNDPKDLEGAARFANGELGLSLTAADLRRPEWATMLNGPETASADLGAGTAVVNTNVPWAPGVFMMRQRSPEMEHVLARLDPASREWSEASAEAYDAGMLEAWALPIQDARRIADRILRALSGLGTYWLHEARTLSNHDAVRTGRGGTVSYPHRQQCRDAFDSYGSLAIQAVRNLVSLPPAEREARLTALRLEIDRHRVLIENATPNDPAWVRRHITGFSG